MLDQAQKLRQLANEELNKSDDKQENKKDENKHVVKNKPIIITVTSGKGGVGKSNFVVNLSIALQKLNKRVLIFDADMGMGNDDVLMGFLPKYNVYDIIFDSKTIEEVLIKGPFGVKLLPGGTGVTKLEEVTESQRERFIKELIAIEDIDYIIIDTGAGINRSVLGFIACCEELIILTTPEPTSLTDAYSLLKAIDHFKLKKSGKVIVNRAMDDDEAVSTYNKFNRAAAKFLSISLEYLGKVCEDRKLIEAVRKQKPFVMLYPNSKVSKDIIHIAQKIIGEENFKSGTSVQDLFRKIFSIFS